MGTNLPGPETAGQAKPAPRAIDRADTITIRIEHPTSQAARRCLEAYAAELAERLEEELDTSGILSIGDGGSVPPDGLFLVAVDGAEPVGCVALKLEGPESAQIKRMWIAPRVRGRGLGRRLLTAIETHAWDLGVRRVRLETNRALVEAISLYRASGYEEAPSWREEDCADHWFEKRLTDRPRTDLDASDRRSPRSGSPSRV